ncbi:hypothetical protein [Ramlibacter sp.]|uniref:hypothetical protein n=1 Tax=Ramlibacter sp. TaxID=1917967 RepID=UPI003D0EA18E
MKNVPGQQLDLRFDMDSASLPAEVPLPAMQTAPARPKGGVVVPFPARKASVVPDEALLLKAVLHRVSKF